jgi:hypothetical protein
MSQEQVDARTQADFYRERAEIFRSRSGSFLKSVRARRSSVALAAYYERLARSETGKASASTAHAASERRH